MPMLTFVTLLLRQSCYLNGQWLAADNAKTIDVTNLPPVRFWAPFQDGHC